MLIRSSLMREQVNGSDALWYSGCRGGSRGGNRLSTGEISDVPNDKFPSFRLFYLHVELRLS